MLSAECQLCSPFNSAFRLLGEALKGCGVFDREVSQDLAVELQARRLQAVDELVVAHAVQLGRGADADNPQRAILTLLLLASGIGELQATIDSFFRRTVKF